MDNFLSLVMIFAIERTRHNRTVSKQSKLEAWGCELNRKALGSSCTCTGLALWGNLDRFACAGHYPGSRFPFGLQHASDEPCESMMGWTDNRKDDDLVLMCLQRCPPAWGAGKIIVCEMCIIYCNKTTSTMRSDRWDVFFSVICCVSGRGRVNVNTDKWVFNSRGLYEGLFCPGWTHILVTHRFVHAHSRLWHKTSLSLTLSVSPSDVHANTQTKRLPLRE